MIWGPLLKYGLAAVVVAGVGFEAGKRWERATQVDAMRDQVERHEQQVREIRREHTAVIAAQSEAYRESVRRYEAALERARTDAARSRRLAKTAQETRDELQREIDRLLSRLGDDSRCSFDSADLGVWRDAIQAANAGLPGNPE